MNSYILLSNFISAALLPPLNLVLLCLAGLLLRRRWSRLGSTVSVGALGLLVVLSTNAGAGLLLVAPLERQVQPLQELAHGEVQAIVVLGGGRLSQAPDYGGADSPNGIELARLRYAARLQRGTGLPILVSGGAPDGSAESEAALMARSLREDFRVPVQWVEDRSNTTAENAIYSARMLNAVGIKRILLVTDAMHMVRSHRIFQEKGLTVIPAPTVFFSAQRRTALDFVPNGEALRRSHYALHEWIGLLWYRLRYAGKSDISGAAHSGAAVPAASSATAS